MIVGIFSVQLQFLHDACLLDCDAKRDTRIVDRPQESQNVTAKLPFLRGHCCAQQADRVSLTVVQLFERV